MSNAALTPRSSGLAVIPTRQELETWGPADRWALEARLGEAASLVAEVNNEELRHWIEVEGKTQTEVARTVGVTQGRISQRCSALGIVSRHTSGGQKREVLATNTSTDTGIGDAEEVDAEIVEDDGEPAAPSRPSPPSQPAAAPDPGPRVKCPTCGHMVVPSDIQTWKE